MLIRPVRARMGAGKLGAEDRQRRLDLMPMPTASSLIFRRFEERDAEQTARLFQRQWHDDLEPRAGRLVSEATVCNYLMDTDWGLVGEVDGRLMGTALVSHGTRGAETRDRWLERREALLAEAAPGTRFGVDVAGLEAEEGALARRYAEAGGVGSGAEIKLLIVSPDARGMGMGRRLVQAVADHVRDTGRTGFFLITDDACDVGFYDHLGLTRQLEEPSRAEPGLNLYVYSKELG